VPVGQGVGLLDPAHGYVLALVDEAGQVTEPAAYAGFLADARCTVLIGDPAQLPPFVKSEEAKHCGHHISLLERLYSFVGIPFVFLPCQYRMHQDISQVSNRHIYANRFQDDPGTRMRVKIGGLPWQNRTRFIWYHVDGWEQADGATGHGCSFSNEAEAAVCVSLADDILESSPPVNVALHGMDDAQVSVLKRPARVIITLVHFLVQALPATRSFVCQDGCSHASRKHISCSVLFKISLAARSAVSLFDYSQVNRGFFLNSTSLFVALPKNVIIPQLAVHPNLQVAVLLIVLTFRLFLWGIVPGEFICCDPRSCVVAAKGHLT